MILVDTNILAGLLFSSPLSVQAAALYAADPDWHSDAFIMVELSNVLTTQIRLRAMPLDHAVDLLGHAAAVMRGGLQHVSHTTALSMAAQFSVSAYDARYLALAQALDTRLVTEDIKLRNRAHTLTCSLADALAR